MGWFKLKPPPPAPPSLAAWHTLYGLLFGDVPLAQFVARVEGEAAATAPWSLLLEAAQRSADNDVEGARSALRRVLELPNLESRTVLQTWHALRTLGVEPPPELARQAHGVVVEVGLDTGTDVLAAYADHTARYLNQSGKVCVWEAPESELDPLIDDLLRAGQAIAEHAGTWDQPRLPPPQRDIGRINVLTNGGLRFGQGRLEDLGRDPLAGAALQTGGVLLQALVEKALKE